MRNIHHFSTLLRVVSILTLSMFLMVSCTGGHKGKPNIVFVMVDGFGYSDVSYLGLKDGVVTPNIDALRKESMMFSSAYVAGGTFEQTKSSILTGHYDFDEGMLNPANRSIAKGLKSEGYKTAFVGDYIPVSSPLRIEDNRGFDVYYSHATTSSLENDSLVDRNEYFDATTDAALSFISESSTDPFICFVSYENSKAPCVKHGMTNDAISREHLAFLNDVDDNVGRLMSLLSDKSYDNTMVVFYSATVSPCDNTPFRGVRGSVFEGGLRVPLLIKYPTLIAANSSDCSPIISDDFLPTIFDVVGMETDGLDFDGQSFSDILFGVTTELPSRLLYWRCSSVDEGDEMLTEVIRDGDWKLIVESSPKRISLYNLENDPYEFYNLSFVNNDIVNSLSKSIEHYSKD